MPDEPHRSSPRDAWAPPADEPVKPTGPTKPVELGKPTATPGPPPAVAGPGPLPPPPPGANPYEPFRQPSQQLPQYPQSPPYP
jgi:hypothetical protein